MRLESYSIATSQSESSKFLNIQQNEKCAKQQGQKWNSFAKMSASLNDACMAGNVEEVLMRLNMGEDVNQVKTTTFKRSM